MINRHGRGQRAFTLIEVMLVVTVTTLGFVAMFDLQANSVRGLRNSKHMLEASTIAENFVEQMRLEFSEWTMTQPLNPTQFPHLAELPTDGTVQLGQMTPGGSVEGGQGWVIAGSEMNEDRRVGLAGPTHPFGYNSGVKGALIEEELEDTALTYCLLYRLMWLVPNRALRLEVEVQWPLEHTDMDSFVTCSKNAANQLDQVRSVTLTDVIAVNHFRR